MEMRRCWSALIVVVVSFMALAPWYATARPVESLVWTPSPSEDHSRLIGPSSAT